MWLSCRVKEQAESPQTDRPWPLNIQHQESVSSGEGMLLLSIWYITECRGFPYPNTSWHWRLHRSQGSGGRPGPCTRPRAAHHHGSGSGGVGNRYQGAVTCHGRLGWAAGSKAYDSNPFFIEKSFPNAWLRYEITQGVCCYLWGGTDPPLLHAENQKKKKIQLCRGSLLYRVSFPSCFPSFLPACRQF